MGKSENSKLGLKYSEGQSLTEFDGVVLFWQTNLLISARPQRQNQCKRVPDHWRPGSVKIKRYYTKNGRLIPTAKRGKEIKQQ